MEEEVEFLCPYCGENISIVADLSIDEQQYIEDCSVCCKPIDVHLSCEEGALLRVDGERSQ